jgi:hypothetical protein
MTWFSKRSLSILESIQVSNEYPRYFDIYQWNKKLKLKYQELFINASFQFYNIYILGCVLSVSQKSWGDSSSLNKCSTEKLCLLADEMLVSMIMLRINVPP